jgi:hypothetical protein
MTLAHVYQDVNPHTVTVTVTDRGGLSVSVSQVYTATKQSFNTTTTLAVTPGPFVVGQSVTLTATVSNTSGALLPTGHVEFFAGKTDLGRGTVPVAVSGSGSVVTSSFTLALPTRSGKSNYRAVYVPDGQLSSSAGSLSLTVAPGGVAKLVFVGHPGPMLRHAPTIAPFAVVVTDQFGNRVTGVTVRLDLVPVGGTGPANFSPGSVTAAPALTGVATFVGVMIDTPGVYVLQASVGSVTAFSDPFSVPAAWARSVR